MPARLGMSQTNQYRRLLIRTPQHREQWLRGAPQTTHMPWLSQEEFRAQARMHAQVVTRRLHRRRPGLPQQRSRLSPGKTREHEA